MQNKNKPKKTIENKIIHNGVTYIEEEFKKEYPDLYKEYYN